MNQTDNYALYAWIWKWRMIGIALFIVGIVGASGPYVVDMCDFTGPLSALNDMAILISPYNYYFGMCFVFGVMFLYCIGEFDENMMNKVDSN